MDLTYSFYNEDKGNNYKKSRSCEYGYITSWQNRVYFRKRINR